METFASSKKKALAVTSRQHPITSRIVTKDHLSLLGKEWPFVARQRLLPIVVFTRSTAQKKFDIFWELRVFRGNIIGWFSVFSLAYQVLLGREKLKAVTGT